RLAGAGRKELETAGPFAIRRFICNFSLHTIAQPLGGKPPYGYRGHQDNQNAYCCIIKNCHVCPRQTLGDRHGEGVQFRRFLCRFTRARVVTTSFHYAALVGISGGAARVGGEPSTKEAALSQTCASCR